MPLADALSKNLVFHVILEREVNITPFGQITFNFNIKDGVVVVDSLNVVKNIRRRYKGSVDTGE